VPTTIVRGSTSWSRPATDLRVMALEDGAIRIDVSAS
jgi:hypothetical protein